MRHRIVRRIRAALAHWAWFFWHMRWRARIAAALMIFAVVSVVAIEVTGQPGFCNSYHIMNPYYASWGTSSHAEVNCLDCHLKPGFTGYIKGKINRLAQVVDDVVGRVGTRPSATVLDISCLRSECHSTEELLTDTIDCNGVKFSHANHIDTVVGGMKMSCGMCHSHFEGNEHFSVNRNVCFACHFLGGVPGEEHLTQTGCTDCHDVPKEVIRRGFVKIDHQEFVSYEASCEESCHKREVDQISHVEETVCLSCHDFRKAADANYVELHESHTVGDKVECFACHGQVAHGHTQVESISAMMDCTSCHSNTHQVQRTIYSTEPTAATATTPHSEDRVLSPMFLTHVGPEPGRYSLVVAEGLEPRILYWQDQRKRVEPLEFGKRYPFSNESCSLAVEEVQYGAAIVKRWQNASEMLLQPALVASIVEGDWAEEVVLELNKPDHHTTKFGTLMTFYRRVP